MKQNINPVVAVILGVLVVAVVGLISYKLFGSTSEPPMAAAPKVDTNDPKFKQHLPAGVAGGGG